MGQISEILGRARERAIQLKLPYAGAVLPGEAHQLLQLAPGAKLVDVRTRAEWDWVGSIPASVKIEWNQYPGGDRNPNFLNQLRQQIDPEALTMFICRSGGRSHHAAIAASQAGYQACYNVLEGFEGDKDSDGHRNTKGGWRKAGLPWTQS